MTVAEQRRQDMMAKIRALIAKASDKSVTLEESEAFRAKADELMTRYAIEEWEAISSGRIHTSPVSKPVEFSWYNNGEIDDDVRNNLWHMMNAVYRHARCQIVTTTYSRQTINCMGYAGDLEYADLLFTSLMLQLTAGLYPKADPNEGWYENAVRLREAGFQWRDVIRMMHEAGVLPEKYEDAGWSSRWTYVNLSETVKRRYGRFAQHHKTYKRSFSIGFTNRVNSRLREMRSQAEQSTAHDTNPYAVVVRDVHEVVMAAMYEMYPDMRPREVRATGKVRAGRQVQRKVDWGAMEKGREAGDAADITGHHERRVRRNPKGELDG